MTTPTPRWTDDPLSDLDHLIVHRGKIRTIYRVPDESEAFERVAREITHDWMAHLGYTPEQITEYEMNNQHQRAGCEFTSEGWFCLDENEKSLHPEYDELDFCAELVVFVLEHPALKGADHGRTLDTEDLLVGFSQHAGNDRWETTPRMLSEPCEGPHGGTAEEVFALDLPNGVRLWLCKRCWVDSWRRHGCPEQPAVSHG